jgi:hypothetical protein
MSLRDRAVAAQTLSAAPAACANWALRTARAPSAVVAALLLLANPALARSQRTLALGDWDRGAVERARAGAMRKLETAECRRLLAEFRDTKGRALEANLAEWAMSPAEYTALVPFLDGSREPLCRRVETALVASPGVRRVFVCPSFANVSVRDPLLAESLVIHEILHTLGLGENPPTPREITRRIAARCR